MKRITIIALMLLLMALFVSAGEPYCVFIIKGDVTALIHGKVQPLKGGDTLDESDVINVGKDGYLTLKSRTKKRITLTASRPFRGTIKQLKREPNAKQKHSSRFMLTIEGKTASDFVDSSRRIMSAGGYNNRDLFDDDDDLRTHEELHEMLLKAGLIDR